MYITFLREVNDLAMSEDRKEYLKAYRKRNIKRIPLDVDVSVYRVIQGAARADGMSVNGFIKAAIKAYLAERHEK